MITIWFVTNYVGWVTLVWPRSAFLEKWSEPGSENPNLPGSDIRTRFGTCPTLRDTSPWESPNGVWLTVNDHRLVCDKSWGGGWPWCAFLEEWFGPSPNLQVRISELRFGNPNLQVRNPNLSFGSGIVEYDVKIFNHLLIWVTDDNLNVFKKNLKFDPYWRGIARIPLTTLTDYICLIICSMLRECTLKSACT